MAKDNSVQQIMVMLTATLLLLITGCGTDVGNNDGSVPVSISFSIPSGNSAANKTLSKPAPSIVASMSINISAEDMTPITDTFNVSPDTTVTRNYLVSPGQGRFFSASAYNEASGKGVLLYKGSATADITEDITTAVFIPMSSAGLFVDVNNGDDAKGDGSPTSPYKTITFALLTTTGNEPINVAAGFYNFSSGESFPLQLQTGTKLNCYGADHSTVIKVQGAYTDGIWGDLNASIDGCKITNAESAAINDLGAKITVNNNVITNNCGGINTSADSVITNNIIELSLGGTCNGAAISSFSDYTTANKPTISGNKITDNQYGIYLTNSNPVIKNNSLSCSYYNDLNVYSASGIIDATNNLWDNTPPLEGTATSGPCSPDIDICTDGGVTIDYSGYGRVPSPCFPVF